MGVGEGRLEVFEASNGRAALEERERWQPGLVLLDLMMPEVDGARVIEAMVGR